MPSKSYDLRTLEMVLAWCERQELKWSRERNSVPGSTLWPLECDSRRAQTAKLRRAMQRHAAKAKRGAR